MLQVAVVLDTTNLLTMSIAIHITALVIKKVILNENCVNSSKCNTFY